MKKQKFLFIAAAFLMAGVFLSQAASAQTVFDSLGEILGDTDSFNDFYENYSIWIDLIIFIIIFVSIARVSLGRTEMFSQGPGKTLAIAIGIALAISAAVFEGNSGFRLSEIGPWALALVILIIGYMVYKIAEGIGFGSAQSIAAGLVVGYVLLVSIGSDITQGLTSQWSVVQTIFSLLQIAFILGLFALGWAAIQYVMRRFSNGSSNGGGPRGGSGEDEARREAERQRKHVAKIKKLTKNIESLIEDIANLEGDQAKIFRDLLTILEELERIDKELNNLLEGGR